MYTWHIKADLLRFVKKYKMTAAAIAM